MYHRLSLSGLCFVFSSLVGCEASQRATNAEGSEAEAQAAASNGRANAPDFFSLLRRVHSNYIPHNSMEAINGASELALMGTVTSIEDGRVVGGRSGETRGHHTAVLKVQVAETFKGKSGPYVYVEIPRSMPTSIEELRKARPSERMIFFLEQVPKLPSSVEVGNGGAGMPYGQPLYQLLTPQALVVDGSGRASQPWTDSANESFASRESFENVAERLRIQRP